MRLEQAEEYTFNVIEPHFNSIKVRLKHDVKQYATDFWLFQFHKGTIKTEVTVQIACQHLNFNSIKVRLKLPTQTSPSDSACTFQFHKGTIKTEVKTRSCLPCVISIP